MFEDVREREQSRNRAVVSCLALCLAVLLCGSAARAQSVAFINPGKSDEIYWMTATQAMQAAARSLGMTFEVQYAQREPLKTFEIAREMVARADGKRPDYIVITDDYAVADQLLKIIDAAGVKTFLAYSSIPVDQRAGAGSPRGKYKGWLGSLEPRAEDAGYLTAQALIKRGTREKAFGSDRKLHMLAIAGDRSTPSSIKRNQGMRRAVADNRAVVVDQEVYAAWTREKAGEQADWLYQRYPDAKLVWAGNDLMAFGAMAAWEKRGGKPGADAWFSGINTSTEALAAIKSGRLTSLAGGHFITGAWAVVMIYDYHRGRDFADEGLELERAMFAEFTPQLADRYIERFSRGFDSVDFGRYSKVKDRSSSATTSASRNCWRPCPQINRNIAPSIRLLTRSYPKVCNFSGSCSNVRHIETEFSRRENNGRGSQLDIGAAVEKMRLRHVPRAARGQTQGSWLQHTGLAGLSKEPDSAEPSHAAGPTSPRVTSPAQGER